MKQVCLIPSCLECWKKRLAGSLPRNSAVPIMEKTEGTNRYLPKSRDGRLGCAQTRVSKSSSPSKMNPGPETICRHAVNRCLEGLQLQIQGRVLSSGIQRIFGEGFWCTHNLGVLSAGHGCYEPTESCIGEDRHMRD